MLHEIALVLPATWIYAELDFFNADTGIRQHCCASRETALVAFLSVEGAGHSFVVNCLVC